VTNGQLKLNLNLYLLDECSRRLEFDDGGENGDADREGRRSARSTPALKFDRGN
jgi:hypothetical protein